MPLNWLVTGCPTTVFTFQQTTFCLRGLICSLSPTLSRFDRLFSASLHADGRVVSKSVPFYLQLPFNLPQILLYHEKCKDNGCSKKLEVQTSWLVFHIYIPNQCRPTAAYTSIDCAGKVKLTVKILFVTGKLKWQACIYSCKINDSHTFKYVYRL